MFGRKINFGGVFEDTRKGGERRKGLRYNLPIFVVLTALTVINLLFLGIILQQRYYLDAKLTQTQSTIQDQLTSFNKKVETEAQKAKVTEEAKKTEEVKPKETGKGTIEGSLSYPGKYIPKNMKICAINQETKEETCTDEQISDKKYLFSVGYSLEVPVGTYQVYASVAEWAGYKSYYDQFVVCGSKAGCSDHTPVEVEVKKNETLSDINPIDWYNI
ncbi:MAG: hypothetical protein WC045_01695 [Patescibacteria group bacterium]